MIAHNLAYARSVPPLSGDDLKHFEAIDSQIRTQAWEHGAREVRFPTLISAPALKRAGYAEAFPHLLMGCAVAEEPNTETRQLFEPENLAPPDWFLSPAVCYQAYCALAGRNLATPVAVSSRGRCYRNEDRPCSPGTRQIEFEMREVVFLGEPGWIDEQLSALRNEIDGFAARLGIEGSWHVAEDPFFLPKASGKAHMQRLLETKLEFSVKVDGAEEALAIASINRHGTFFGERFSITGPTSHPIDTACVAFGLDRWATVSKPNSKAQMSYDYYSL